jgi:hypothetical protein
MVRPLGCFVDVVRINKKYVPMQFHVVPLCANVLMSFCDAVRAALISKPQRKRDIDALSIYRHEVYHLAMIPDAVPKCFPPRKVPLALEAEVKEELPRMENEGVITPVCEPTDWCSPMLVRQKPNGKLRVCMDPQYLNSFLKRPVYPLPDIECVFPRFRGAKFFSKMDMTMGFWQVLLDEESSYVGTFLTP